MKQSIQHRLDSLSERFDEITALLAEPDVQNDQKKFRMLGQEYAQINPIVACYQQYRQIDNAIAVANELCADSDPEIRGMAKEELQDTKNQQQKLQLDLEVLLLPKIANDKRNIFLEIRAGTGGDEAAIFAGDLARMYYRYAENRGWKITSISENAGDHGGYKEIVLRIIGQNVYAKLKFEAGTHRVQRVPATETQGRIHTSACTVAIMPEVETIDAIDISPSDLRIDTFRASGAGGQHVNKTDSAIRLTHLPTGVVVECQDERSQHKNRAHAMSLLKARLLSAEQEKHNAEQAAVRKIQVGSGDRSERIRTYNFPQGRLTDHRINLTLYKLEEIIQGDLDRIISLLLSDHQAKLLAQLGDAE